jgi:hypothetical protein
MKFSGLREARIPYIPALFHPSRQAFVGGSIVLLAGAAVLALAVGSRQNTITAGFWFDPVTYDESEPMSDRLGGPITAAEMQTIETIARGEIDRAYAGLRLRFSDRREATYRVRVVQRLRNPMAPRGPASSGESRRIAGIGGQGAVNFQLLSNSAIAYAPAGADREAMIAAIGRGIGRAAVHEYAHLFLGGFPIHDSTDVQSYEYESADRREQYYGDMHWDIAGPVLHQKFGVR